jgi:hypothetical protein
MGVKSRKNQKGQVLLLTVMLLSGAILGATSLASLLILYQLRQTSDIKDSMESIYAADTGIECVWYVIADKGVSYRDYLSICNGSTPNSGAEYKVVLDDTSGDLIFKSVGMSGRSARSFELKIDL